MRNRIIGLGLLTLIGFPIIGFLLIYFIDPPNDWYTFVLGNSISITYQIIIGTLTGFAAGKLGLWLIRTPWMQSSTSKYEKMFSEIPLNFGMIIFLSLAAGIGEELLFRVAIQHFLGIIITAILFIAIHGYINPKDLKITIYGIGLTAFIILIGYFRVHYGIITAIIAHAIYDFVLFNHYRKLRNVA